jgi:crossover junction endodeoxyribonuclease RuvC
MIILGIDPGSRVTGFGIIRVRGQRSELVDHGVIGLKKEVRHGERLRHIYEQVDGLIERCSPDVCAIEMPVYGKNPQSMLKLGRAQAAAMLAALNRGIEVDEYTPKEVKKAVTGNGAAAKEQVAFMVEKVLQMESGLKVSFDALDALAVALCRAHRASSSSAPEYRGWDAFVRANPDRLAAG